MRRRRGRPRHERPSKEASRKRTQRLAERVLAKWEGVDPGERGLTSQMMSHLVKNLRRKGIDLDDKASVFAEIDRSRAELFARWRRVGVPKRAIRSIAQELAKDFYAEMVRLADHQDATSAADEKRDKFN